MDYCDRCDTDTGVCTDGCKTGLEGDYCYICDTETGVCTDGFEIGLDRDYCDRCDTVISVCVYIRRKIGPAGDNCDKCYAD